MIPYSANRNELIESADRLLVEAPTHSQEKGWTVGRTTFAGAIVSFDVEFWPSRERATIAATDVHILSGIAIPPPPQPFWADPAVEMSDRLPTNVVPFVPRWVLAAGGRA